MRLAFSTNAYLKHPFDEAASRIASLGYEGLELLADVPHAWPAGLLDVQKRGILRAMERSQLAFSNINAFMMNAVNDRRQPY
jgi:sugar phosphate isomerase/epimerase